MNFKKIIAYTLLPAVLAASCAQAVTLSNFNSFVLQIRGNFTSTLLGNNLCTASTVVNHNVSKSGNFVAGAIRYSGCKSGEPGRPLANSIINKLNNAAQNVNANAYVTLRAPTAGTLIISYKVFPPTQAQVEDNAKQEIQNQINTLRTKIDEKIGQ